MKKILLVRPQAPGPRFTPLGILYLAGYLMKSGYAAEVHVMDLRSLSLTRDEIVGRLREFSPDLIGISSLSTESVFTHQLIEICRSNFPNVPIVLGGPYASAEWGYVLQDTKVDYCIVGEGEQTFLEFLKSTDSGHDPSTVDGVAARDASGKPVLNNPGGFIPHLDEIPFPAYEFIDMDKYSLAVNSHLPAFNFNRKVAPIFTSRGCPYQCTFCHNIFGKKIRYRSPENVLNEIDWLVTEYGIGEIHFEDDSFNINLKRAKSICQKILAKNYDLKFAFPNGIRADFVDEELVDLFCRMGVYSIGYGVESASNNIRKKIKKSLNLDKLNKSINLTAKRGIVVSGYFMVGFPNETEEELEDTIRFACKSKLHIAMFSRLIPFPGTELYNEVLRLGFKYDREKFHKVCFEKISINFSAMPDQLLEDKILSAMRRFYFNPSRLLRIFLVFPGKLNLILEGLRVFKEKLLKISDKPPN